MYSAQYIKTIALTVSVFMKYSIYMGLIVVMHVVMHLSANAQEITLRLHHFSPPNATTELHLAIPWAKEVEKKSKGRIKVKTYPAMQLGGKAPQLYDQAKDGVVDVVWTLTGYTPGRFPIISVFELPFMVSNATATSQAIQHFYEKYAKKEFKDVHPIFFHVHPRGVIHTRKKPIKKYQDLEGLKIRVPNRYIGETLQSLGATPIFMPVPALPQALARGVVDGAVIPWEITWPLKVHELAVNHAEIKGKRGLYTAIFMLVMNKEKYLNMPPDLRYVIDQVSGLKWAKYMGEVWDEDGRFNKKRILEKGNKLTTIDPKHANEIQQKTKDVIKKWINDMNAQGYDGEKLFKEANALIDVYDTKK